jgi:hypothetical protein
MNLHKLLIIHAFIMLAAGVVLVLAPNIIPLTVGIHVDPHSYLLCYFLGTSEFAFAFLSYYARTLRDIEALRLIVWTIIIFHASTAIVEIYAFSQGLSAAIWFNVVIRVIAVILFIRFGLTKNKIKKLRIADRKF